MLLSSLIVLASSALAAALPAPGADAAAVARNFTVTNFSARHVPNTGRVIYDFDLSFPRSTAAQGTHCHADIRKVPGPGLIYTGPNQYGAPITCDDPALYGSGMITNPRPKAHPNAKYALSLNFDDYYSTPRTSTFSSGFLFFPKNQVKTVESPAGSGKMWEFIDQKGPLRFPSQTAPYP